MASNADIRRLVLNDERLSTLILTFDHTLNIPQLQYALSLNGTVKEIVVYTDETFLPRFPMEEVRGLFEVLGGIPTLQRLCFNSRSGFDGVISVQALIHVLSRATRLASFAVSDLRLDGTEHDWAQFAEQLQRAVYLKSFCIIECELSMPDAAEAALAAVNRNNNNNDSNIQASRDYPLDPMVMVLSILPSMEKVYLHSTRAGGLGEISSQSVGALLLSASLKVLKIRDFELGADTVKAMARMLQANPVLRDLKVGTMKEFHSAAASAFASMLKHNSSLECLEMGLSKMISDEDATTLAKALKVNKGLKSFALTVEDSGSTSTSGMMLTQSVSKHCKEAFVDMLRSNYVMENFVLFQRFPVKPEFKLYVTLNKLGRGRLLQAEETNLEKWIQALATVNDDLDALFYYVSINPELCSLALQENPEKEAKKAAAAAAAQRPIKRRRMTTNEMVHAHLNQFLQSAGANFGPNSANHGNNNLNLGGGMMGGLSSANSNNALGATAAAAAAAALPNNQLMVPVQPAAGGMFNQPAALNPATLNQLSVLNQQLMQNPAGGGGQLRQNQFFQNPAAMAALNPGGLAFNSNALNAAAALNPGAAINAAHGLNVASLHQFNVNAAAALNQGGALHAGGMNAAAAAAVALNPGGVHNPNAPRQQPNSLNGGWPQAYMW